MHHSQSFTSKSDEINQLANITKSQPHASYCAYIHSLSSRWTFLSHTIADIADLLQPPEEASLLVIHPAQVWRGIYWPSQSTWVVWDWLTRYLHLTCPQCIFATNITSSFYHCKPRSESNTVDICSVIKIKASIRQSNQKHWLLQCRNVYDHLSPQLKCYVDLTKEKGASSWLSVLPLDDHGLPLHKGAFGDAICLCYGWK